MTNEAQPNSVGAAAPGAAYWEAGRREIARVLSWQDREACSRSYGCFDRTYWCWKFTDFPGARFQEGVYTLAHLFSARLNENPLHEEPRALQWISAGLKFWQRIQRRDGSFDEAYPFEHSLAATAFTGFYLGEAFLRVRESLHDGESVLDAFARAGDWLCRNDERHGILSNHLAAAAAGLHAIFRITGEARFERRSRQFLQRIYDRQSHEGWYEEYGGADPGYQTLTTFYLAHVLQHTGDAVLQESLTRSLTFLEHCIHPNGTLGGEYGSRSTEFFFPAGFEMLAANIPGAARIARFMRAQAAPGAAAGLAAMDAQNLLPMLNNYLIAAERAVDLDAAEGDGLPCELTGEWWFPDAGLLMKSTPGYYAVVGLARGGIVKIYDKAQRTLALSDCGYVARSVAGTVAGTQALRRGGAWTRAPGTCAVETDFVPLVRRLPNPWLFVAFRVFSMTAGRIGAAAYWLKNRLVRFLMRTPPAQPLRLTRRVVLDGDSVTITDDIVAAGDARMVECVRVEKCAALHMGSSRYFQRQELDVRPRPALDCAQALAERGRVRAEWTWSAGAARPDA